MKAPGFHLKRKCSMHTTTSISPSDLALAKEFARPGGGLGRAILFVGWWSSVSEVTLSQSPT
jgi:hypothetical protein